MKVFKKSIYLGWRTDPTVISGLGGIAPNNPPTVSEILNVGSVADRYDQPPTQHSVSQILTSEFDFVHVR